VSDQQDLAVWQPNPNRQGRADGGSRLQAVTTTSSRRGTTRALLPRRQEEGRRPRRPTAAARPRSPARWLLKNHIAKGGRVLWFAHRRSLLRQAFRTFADAASLAAPKTQLKLITISSEDCKWSTVSKEHDVRLLLGAVGRHEGNFGFLDL